MYDLKDRIFNLSTSKTFQTIVQKLVQTDAKGEEREDVTIIALRKIFGTEDVHKIGGLGSEEDINGFKKFIESTKNMDEILNLSSQYVSSHIF